MAFARKWIVRLWVLPVALGAAGARAQTIPAAIANAPGNNAAPNGPGLGAGGADYQNGGAYGIDNVLGRYRPEYAPLGVDLGRYQLYPHIDVGGFYDSNIYSLQNHAIGDGGVRITPDLQFRSKGPSNPLTLDLTGTIVRYADQTIQNSESGSATLTDQLDIDQNTQLFTTARVAQLIQQTGTEEAALVGVTSPLSYREFSGSINGQRRFGDLLFNVGATAAQDSYDSAEVGGAKVSLHDDDSHTLGLNTRLQYQIGPGIGVFASGSYTDQVYATSTRVPNRNSTGFSTLGGIAFGVTRLLTGEIGLGYLDESFASAAYPNIHALDYSFKLNWSPSPLVDVTANVGRSFQHSPIVNSAGIRLDTATFSVDYELLRNLLLSVSLTYTANDYRGLDIREGRVDGSLAARYLINHRLSLVATAYGSHQRRLNNSASGIDYDRSTVTAGARYQL